MAFKTLPIYTAQYIDVIMVQILTLEVEEFNEIEIS